MEQERPTRKKRTKEIKRLTARMQAKLLFAFALFVIAIFALIARLIVINNTEKYKKSALELQSYVSSTINYKRGDILDRNGHILATSELQYHLILDPKVVLDREAYKEPTVKALCDVYGFSESEILDILDKKSQSSYVVLRKKMSYDEKAVFTEYVNALDKNTKKLVKGVWFEEEYKRTYPYNTLASHLIGFTVSGDVGMYGIEQAYNDILIGTNGRTYGYYDGNLQVVESTKEATDGSTVISTIDFNVQRVVEKHVEKFLDEYGAKNVGVIVMDANNGEIIAMQSNYSYDLNNPRNLSRFYTLEEVAAMSDEEQLDALYSMWRNFCISDAYEPGSIFKPFTVATALEESIIKTSDKYVCDGGEDFPGNVRIKCARTWGHGELSLAESIMFSCNDALMQIVAKVGKETFNNYQEDFCIGSITNVDIPGEANGNIFSLEQLNETELATSSFGQGFTTTMIQMCSSFCALINGGTYYQPHTVKKIQNSAGATIKTIEPVVVNKTLSQNTSEFIKEALYLTITDGTGKSAAIDGYKIGGKTGTSQKLPRDAEKYLVSFLGFIENDDMNVAFYVIVDECDDKELQNKSTTAMKLFADIGEEALPYLKVYPEGEIDYHIDIITDEDLNHDIQEDPNDSANVFGTVENTNTQGE